MSNEPIDMGGDELAPLDLDGGDAAESGSQEIRAFGSTGGGWKSAKVAGRKPTVTGQGAVKVKTFYTKLRADAIEFLDDQINQYLEQNPECEVKFVTTNIGPMVGKNTEPTLFVNVWM